MARAVTETRLDRLFKAAGDVLERRERAGLDRDYERYADDPVGFARDVLKVTPWKKQIQVMETVRDEAQTSVRGGVGVGKDFTGACLALWWCYARHGLVLVTSASQRQVREIFFAKELRRLFHRGHLPGTVLAQAVKPPDGWAGGVLGFTSSEVDKLTGFHDQRVFGILSEAQGLDDDAWVAMRSCAVSDTDRLLAVGNPTNPLGRFFASQRAGSGWSAITMSVFDHPNVVEGKSVIPGGPEAGWLERVKREEGEGSAYWKGRVLAEFPEQAAEMLFRREWVEAAVQRWVRYEHPAGPISLVLGCDIARLGTDATAIAVRRDDRILGVITWHMHDTMASVSRIQGLAIPGLTGHTTSGGPVTVATMSRANITLIVDVTGGGSGPGVADRLRELGYTVRDWHSSAPPGELEGMKHPVIMRRARNARAEGYLVLRDQLRDGAVALPPDSQLVEELLAISYEEDARTGQVKIAGKPALRALLGRSPDRADAVMLAVAGSGGATAGAAVGLDF